ncbi:MAG: gamma carbonic anhydrase family protein [Gammaproteobacteria bacterium]|nr:gamma carbonic anhydrase family protein [Gammaproteobacteria bacterium]
MAIRGFAGRTPRLGARAYVDAMALALGDVTLGDDASLWPMAVARGDVQAIRIGARTNIQDGSVLHVTQDNRFNPGGRALIIGDDVTVGHGVILHACTVEDLVLVGMGSTVLDGAVIQSRVMIGAGSLVSPNKVLESGYLYLGSPAKQARPLTEKELEYLEFSAKHYVELKNLHLQEAVREER